jgi:hypothetical protein
MGLNFSALKRIEAGFFTGAMAMVWAAGKPSSMLNCCSGLNFFLPTVVQHYIYKVCFHCNSRVEPVSYGVCRPALAGTRRENVQLLRSRLSTYGSKLDRESNHCPHSEPSPLTDLVPPCRASIDTSSSPSAKSLRPSPVSNTRSQKPPKI